MGSKNESLPAPSPSSPQRGGMKIIHAGLFRTGTASMAEAYRILGYKTHHGLDNMEKNNWPRIEEAAEATWPHLANLPGYTYRHNDGAVVPRPPFQREDWETIWGEYDIATDLASPFVLELIKAYPDAKVVVVERDFNTWWPSAKSELLDSLFHSFSRLQKFVVWNIMGIRAIQAMQKVHAGFFSAEEYSKEAIIPNAREAYTNYYDSVRAAVPLESGRRLDYKLGSGWEPLCRFLGKDVPAVDFPRVNDRQSHSEGVRQRNMKILISALRSIAPVVILLLSVGFIYYR